MSESTTPVAGDDNASKGSHPALEELRGQLDGIGDTPIDQRPALLEAANAALVAALAQLEEV